MSRLTEEMAEGLARDVVAYVDATGDEEAIRVVIQALADRSQTLEEAFVTALRTIRANTHAREVLAEREKAWVVPKRVPPKST